MTRKSLQAGSQLRSEKLVGEARGEFENPE
jgi:hypothetical protein